MEEDAEFEVIGDVSRLQEDAGRATEEQAAAEAGSAAREENGATAVGTHGIPNDI